MKRFLLPLLTGLLSISLLLGMAQLAGAEETATPEVTLGEDGTFDDTDTFNVSDILTTENQGQKYFNDDQTETPLLAFILDIINFILQVFGAVAMLFIIIGGLLMIVSEGDENRLNKGKTLLTASIIGMVISMMSYVIVRFFQSIFYVK